MGLMRSLVLTKHYHAVVDDSDYDAVSQHKWTAQVSYWPNGTVKAIYAYRFVGGRSSRKKIYLHRFIAKVDDPRVQVDHRDHDGLNCQRGNLRICSNAQNSRHQRLKSTNTSGRKGVCWNGARNKWQANITINGRLAHLGLFVSLDDASAAYDRAARINFGEFALLNAVAA